MTDPRQLGLFQCPVVQRRFLWWKWQSRKHRGYTEVAERGGYYSTIVTYRCYGCGEVYEREFSGP